MTPTDDPDGPADLTPPRAEGEWSPAADRAVRVILALVLAFMTLAVVVVVPLLAIACSTCQDGVRNWRFPGLVSALTWYVVPAVGLVSVLGVCTARRSGVAAAVGGGALAGVAALILILGQFSA